MRPHRVFVITAAIAVSLLSLAACGAKSLSSYAQGTWGCRWVSAYDGTAYPFTLEIGNGTWAVTEGEPNIEDSGTWSIDPSGVTITDERGNEYTGASNAPSDIENGNYGYEWEQYPLDVTITGDQVEINYSDFGKYQERTVCGKK